VALRGKANLYKPSTVQKRQHSEKVWYAWKENSTNGNPFGHVAVTTPTSKTSPMGSKKKNAILNLQERYLKK
jgi:hypothetical protein